MKKAIALVLVIFMAITAAPLVGFTRAEAADWKSVLSWRTISGGREIEILSCMPSATGSISVPSKINGLPVTAIGALAFYGCDKLTEVTLPSTVVRMDTSVFSNCSRLKKVTLSTGMATIGDSTFYKCTALTGVTIPNKVAVIGGNAFYGCTALTGITIPSNVASIGENAFEGCSALTKVTISNGLKTIGYEAFNECSALKSISIPGSVKTIGEYAFGGCSAMTGATIASGLTDLGKYAFSHCTSLKNVTLPNSVRHIGESAFYETALYSDAAKWTNGSLYIGNCLIDTNAEGDFTVRAGTVCLADEAFGAYAWRMTSVFIPDSVAGIGSDTFFLAQSLTAIEVDSGNSYFRSVSGVLFNKNGTKLLCYPRNRANTSYTVPASVKTIGELAFAAAYNLTGITLPNGLTAIGKQAFNTCEALTAIAIPSGVTKVSDFTFINCKALKSAALPKTIKSIGIEAFMFCQSLTHITVPSSVTSIGYSAFENCSSLKSVTISNGVIDIGYNAFMGCSVLAGVTLPLSVRTIKGNAFYDCPSIKSVKIPAGISEIDTKAFGYYYDANGNEKKVSGFKINTYAYSIGEKYAKENKFSYQSTALKSIKLKSGPTKVRYYAGDSLNYAGIALSAAYNDNTTHTISGGYTCSPAYLYNPGAQTVKVTFGGKSVNCTVYVAPATPYSIGASSMSYNSIKISWSSVDGATGYGVYRATSKTGKYTYVKGTSSTSLTDTSRTTGTLYYYKVRAYKTIKDERYYGKFTEITYAKALPATPTSFTAAKASSTSIKTSWKAVSGASGYEVWMATSSGGSYSKLTTTTKTTYTKTGLTKNKTYYFRVRAYRTINGVKVFGVFTSGKSAKPY